jgi:carboxyl-terminal processing protease
MAVLVALTAVSAASAAAAPLQGEPHYAEIARSVADGLPSEHFDHEALGDTIAEQALKNYLNALDYDHSYFLAEDIASFEEHAREMDDELKHGRLRFAFDVFEVLQERASNRLEYVEALLEKGFDFGVEETFQPRRRDARWPSGQAEWDDL